MENYYHPGKRSKKSRDSIKAQKSFNQCFLDLTLRSEKFRTEVENYLNLTFLQESTEEIKGKIDKFIVKCSQKVEAVLAEEGACYQTDRISLDAKVHKALQEYILENSKCKIPWSRHELIETMDFVRSYISMFKVETKTDFGSQNDQFEKTDFGSQNDQFEKTDFGIQHNKTEICEKTDYIKNLMEKTDLGWYDEKMEKTDLVFFSEKNDVMEIEN